jgi:hypothetical protein
VNCVANQENEVKVKEAEKDGFHQNISKFLLNIIFTPYLNSELKYTRGFCGLFNFLSYFRVIFNQFISTNFLNLAAVLEIVSLNYCAKRMSSRSGKPENNEVEK